MSDFKIENIDLKRIRPSKTNPRKSFDAEKLKELADSIRTQGIIQPLVVRPAWCIGKSADDIAKVNGEAPVAEFYELVAGERRFRAAGMVALATVPLIVRFLTDQETVELQLIENLQRDDLDPFEEANGYHQLLDFRDGHNKPVHTVDTICRRVGKPRQRIYFRLKLLKAPDVIRQAVHDGLAVEIAEAIGAIPTKELREAAAEQILHPDRDEGPLNVRKTRELIAANYMRSLAGAPFDTTDAELVPVIDDDQTGERIGGGACGDCPMRTGNMEAVIGKTKRPEVCTNPKCFLMKCDAQFARLQENATKEGKRVLNSSEAAEIFETDSNKPNFGALRFDSDYVKLTDKPYLQEVRQDFQGRMPHWKTILDGLPKDVGRPEIVVARDPRARIVELVDRKLAIEAVNLAAKQKGEVSLFDRSSRPPSPSRSASSAATGETGDREQEAWKKQDRKNREIAKLNFRVTLAAMTELIGKIDKQGAVKGFWDAVIKASVTHAGHDGAWLICKRNGLDPKKGKHVEGFAYEGVEGAALEYGLSLADDKMKQAFVVELLISQRVKIYNTGSMGGVRQTECFKEFAKLYKVDINEIERRVKAETKEKKNISKRATPNGGKPDQITTENGLLYQNGHVIHLPKADSVAIAHGYMCAEEFVRALTKKPSGRKPPAHKWEKITSTKFRCEECGASAVKHAGKMIEEKAVRGKPCSQSESRQNLRPKKKTKKASSKKGGAK